MPRIPDALEMRDLKYGRRREAAERDRVAALLREEGRRAEAVLLFDGRPDHPFLAEEQAWAVAGGRVFHLLALRRLGRDVGDEDLRRAATSAEKAGRWMEARLGWLALDDEAALRRFAEHLPRGLRPAPEPTSEETQEEAPGA